MNNSKSNPKSFRDNDGSINLVKVFSILFRDFKTIKKIVLYFFITGIFFAIFLPENYTSQSTFTPQVSNGPKPNSSISGLASLAGINLSDIGAESSEISPLLYPQIIDSYPFKLELLSSKIIYEGKTMSLRNYLINELGFDFIKFIKKYSIDIILSFLNNLLKNDDLESLKFDKIYVISEEDHALFEILEDIINTSINQQDGFITISVTDKVPEIPAQIASNAETILQSKIIDFKIKSSREFLLFSEEQYNIKRKELNSLQDEIAIFQDKNVNINSLLFQNKLNRLLGDAQILQTVVQQLATQVEQAKIQVSKNTPVFTVIQPVSIPFKKSGPSRLFIVLFFLFLGIVFSFFNSLFRDQIFKIINTIKTS